MSSVTPSNLARLTLPALVAQWARAVDYLTRQPVSDAEYLVDLQIRHEIAQRLRAKPTTLETREMLAEIDEQFRVVTVEQADCVCDAGAAASAGWTAEREWYFWRGRAG